MGLLNDIWWLSGIVMASSVAIAAVSSLRGGHQVLGAGLIVVALAALLLPEYVRWRLFGGSSILEHVPGVGGGDADEA